MASILFKIGLLLILVAAFAECREGRISNEVAHVVAKRCCNPQALFCCQYAIHRNEELNCAEQTPADRLIAANCIQNELFPNSTETFNTQHLHCCDVYWRNDNDHDAKCVTHCTSNLMKVGLHPDKRIEIVKDCEQGTTLENCFVKCINFLTEKKYRRNFVFEHHCSWRERMIPGKIYMGPQVRRR